MGMIIVRTIEYHGAWKVRMRYTKGIGVIFETLTYDNEVTDMVLIKEQYLDRLFDFILEVKKECDDRGRG